ncbi:hypothetical protein [Candidatus Magnetominusculus dajiuhuensis]|uniref:hypothetical protein n=1 Tax=Candidatus Magnetominusculus dajiuhuensis TaxID=3137712 RepID=UPI003B4344C7
MMSFGSFARVNRFLSREELSTDEFYQLYYESSGLPKDQVIEVLNFLAIELHIPAALLRPTDRFTEELEPKGLFFENAFDGLIMELDIRVREQGLTQIPDIKNIDEYIRCTIEHRAKE